MSQRAQESESQDLKTKRPLNHEPKQYEEQINYYNEYCRLYLANIVLATQLKELSIEKSELLARLLKLEVRDVLYRRRLRKYPMGTVGNLMRRRDAWGGLLWILLATTNVK